MYAAESGTLVYRLKIVSRSSETEDSAMFLTFVYMRELFRYSMEMLVDFVDAACHIACSHRNAVKIFVRRKRIAIFPSSTCTLESWLISTAEKQMLNHRRKEYYKSRGGACVFYRQHLTIKETTCKRTMCCNY